MIIWLDAQLSPALAPWIQSTFGVEAHALRDIGLRDAKDEAIFQAAHAAKATVMTIDSDFKLYHHRWNAATDNLADLREHIQPLLANSPDEGLASRPALITGGGGSS